MTFNLATFKYRKVLSKHGGPVVRLDCHPKEIRQGEFGYEARAELSDGNCFGLGSHEIKEVATHKAISEALERWAFHEMKQSKHKSLFGFDLDPSTTGMAAYPGLFKTEARHLAYAEALERYAVLGWWNRELPAIARPYKKDIEAAEIRTFHTNKVTAILWHRELNGHVYYYGFSSGENLCEACHRAEIELWRKKKVTQYPESHKFFLETMEYTQKLHTTSKSPKLLVDEEIKGPWSKYTTVWRCLLGEAKEV